MFTVHCQKLRAVQHFVWCTGANRYAWHCDWSRRL